MSKQFMPELDAKERLRILTDTADRSEQTTYFKQLTQDELDAKQWLLSQNAIKKFKLDEELKEIKSDFKSKTEPLVNENLVLMREIDTGQSEVDGMLFYLADQSEGMMEIYDQEGALISTRRLFPNEKQQRLPFIRPAANDE